MRDTTPAIPKPGGCGVARGSVGRRLREVREQRGKTQKELAVGLERLGLGVHPSAIAKIEKGDRGIYLNEALALAALLDAHPHELFTPLDDEAPMEVRGDMVHRATEVRAWVQGRRPLKRGTPLAGTSGTGMDGGGDLTTGFDATMSGEIEWEGDDE